MLGLTALLAFYFTIRTCIASTLRLAFMHNLDFEDITWSLPLPAIFTGLEPSMAASLCCAPLLRPLLRAGKRQRSSRVRVAGNTHPRTHQYDPDLVARLKLRPDRVGHRAVVQADPGPREPQPIAGVGCTDSDDSILEIKEERRHEHQITVNKQWHVTSERGDWTQMLGSR